MKKFYPIILSIFLFIILLYGRTFLLQDTLLQNGQTPEKRDSQPLASTKVQDTIKIDNKTRMIFPPTTEVLILPAYNWPPFNVQESPGKWKGADIEITEAVLNRMGYRVKWVEFSFARALEEMRSSNYLGMAPCVTGGGREEYILFSEPVSSIYSVLWKKKNDIFSWQTYDDLQGRVIGASYYHYGAGFLEAAEAGKFKLDRVASKTPELIHFRKLMEDKIDMFISERSVGLYLQHQYAPQFDQIDYCPAGVGPARPFCFAISKSYFEGKEDQLHSFAETFNRKLAIFSKQGHRRKIFEKYHMLIQLDNQGMVILPGGENSVK